MALSSSWKSPTSKRRSLIENYMSKCVLLLSTSPVCSHEVLLRRRWAQTASHATTLGYVSPLTFSRMAAEHDRKEAAIRTVGTVPLRKRFDFAVVCT